MTLVFAAIVASACLPGACDSANLQVSETRVQIVEETVGRGRPVERGDEVCIDFQVLLPDGGVVMKERGFCFRLGAGAVISGVDETVLGMRLGGQRVSICPPHKHWGRAGYGDGAVPPATDLTLDITLRSVG